MDYITMIKELFSIMPELPEVETVVRDLRKTPLINSRVLSAHVLWKKTAALPKKVEFIKTLKNRTVTGIRRRAKFIILDLSGGWSVLIHLRMTGRLTLKNKSEPLSPYARLYLTLDNNSILEFADTRKFGRWYLSKDVREKLKHLGPEPLDVKFKPALFYSMVKSSKRMIKALLLDQTFVSGLGNIYVDESLWLSKIHPATITSKLNKTQAAELHTAIQSVLRKGIKNAGTSLGKSDLNFYSVSGRQGRNQDALNVYRRKNQPCGRCKTLIKRIVIAQRGSHICPKCQILKSA